MTIHVSTARRRVVAGALTIGGLVAVAAVPGSAAAAEPGAQGSPRDGAPCGSSPRFDHDGDENLRAREKAPMRTGSGPSCRVVDAVFPSERLDPFCYVFAPSNGWSWSYVYNVDRNTQGWVRDDHLEGAGADVECPEF